MNNIAILSLQNEIIESFISSAETFTVDKYRNIDSIKSEGLNVLFVDISYIENNDDIQFFLSKIRKKLVNIPIILILQAYHINIINTEWYYNDFILYPFRKGEIELRVKKYIANVNYLDEKNLLKVGKLIINKKEYSVFLDNERIDFTYKEFELLCYLVENKGKVFSRNELLKKIWGIEYIGGTRTVDVHIRRLRSKLGIEFNSIIETIRNVGYRCVE